MKKTKKTVIFGNGRFSELVHYFLTNDSSYDTVSFTISKNNIKKQTFMNLPLIVFEEIQMESIHAKTRNHIRKK